MLDKVKDFNKDLGENVLEFALKPARKDPPDDNWLSKLEKGTRFLARRKNMNVPELGDFLVASEPKEMRAVFLGYDLNNREGGFRFVDPVNFSRGYELFDILETEQEDGNNPELQEGRMDGHEGSEEQHGIHEGK